MELQLRPATAHDLLVVRDWFHHDGGSTGLLGSYGADEPIVNLTDPKNCWVAVHGTEVVAIASLTEDRARQAHIGFMVKPAQRRKGIAKAFIPVLLKRHEMQQYSKIVGTLHLENTAAQKVLRRAGFHQTGYDQNGLVIFERR